MSPGAAISIPSAGAGMKSLRPAIQSRLQDHFVIGVPQHRPHPEGYVDRLAERGKGAHDGGDIVEAVPGDRTRPRAPENRLVFEEQSRGAQDRNLPRVDQPKERIACPPAASECGDDDIRIQHQSHEAKLGDIPEDV